jgi:hypothetical protein
LQIVLAGYDEFLQFSEAKLRTLKKGQTSKEIGFETASSF